MNKSDESQIDGDTSRRTSSRRRNRLSDALKGQSSVPVISQEYLDRYSSKKDLVQRLRNIVDALSDDDVECNSPDYPGLARLANAFVKDKYLKHKDKEVRLYTVLGCMAIFRLYVPEPPYDENEILTIFAQVIQQLSNLSNCTSPTQPNFTQYYKLLEELAICNTGVVLADMIKTLDTETELESSPYSGSPTSDEAMETLRELIEVLLNRVTVEHPSEVTTLAVSAISACVDEFYSTVPIPILDEILKCVGAGPVIYVTNPAFTEASHALSQAKKRGKKIEKKKLPPPQIQQTNQSYIVACGVIKKTIDKISTPVASLLNGILNGDTNVMSNISASDEPIGAEKGTIVAAAGCIPERVQPNADVWSIIYELHRISPQILTTVIGTVASSLQSPDEDKRLRVTKLLGRLFYSKTSDIGVNFHACYKEWIRRSMDMDVKIRDIMVKCLLEILKNKANTENVCEEATGALVKMVTSDPSLDIRISCIHKICDLVYSINNNGSGNKPMISVPLLKAVGNRVSSKNKKERLDSVTGLAKIYHRQYMLQKLKNVQEGGDDCNIDIILETIQNNCDLTMYKLNKKTKRMKRKILPSPARARVSTAGTHDHEIDEKYKFISKRVFDCAFFTDATDPIMRNRVVMIVDDVLLGTGTAAVKEGSSSTSNKSLTSTSRAVGLTMIVNYLLAMDERNDDEEQKASSESGTSYKWMCSLFVQRAKLQLALKAYLDSKSKAEQLPNGSEERNNANAEAFEKLELVASLSSPPSANSSPGVTSESLDTILNKVHTARDKHIFRLLASISSPTHSLAARSRALDDLPKRTKSLGQSASSWIKSLARRCAMGHFVNIDTITECIILAQEAFQQREFQVSMAFLECVKVAVNIYPTLGGGTDGFESLVELFGECRTLLKDEEDMDVKEIGILTALSGILAIVAPSRVSPVKSVEKSPACEDDLKSELYRLCTSDGTPEQARHAVFTMAALVNEGNKNKVQEQEKSFTPLLKTLTSSSSMCLSIEGENNEKIINVLTTLTALVETVPTMFMRSEKSDRGGKSVRFALETVLLGHGREKGGNDDEPLSDDEKMEESTPLKRKKNRRKGPAHLSLTCQRAIAAVDFLVCHIRSTLLLSRTLDKKSKYEAPSEDHISAVFDLLVNLLRDGGYLPASNDRQECSNFHERATLRKSAAIGLLRLCDGSLNLENKFLTPTYWHILSKTFLDEDHEVRDSVMNELSMMLTGKGKYRVGEQGSLPSLRFLACITLCPGDDHHAANVGRRATTTKEAASQCITSLRITAEETLLQCRAISKKAEENFNRNLKMKLMPEFAVPYAFHLLSFNADTPSGGFIRRRSSSRDEDEIEKEEISHKLLRKRLRWLFEPLVQSLGDNADNISFLLRLTELLGHRYRPLDVSYPSSSPELPMSPFSDISLGEKDNKENDELSQAKLKVICTEAREMLLKFVKKDSNLNPYPGAIQIPSLLYTRSNPTKSPAEKTKSGSRQKAKRSTTEKSSPTSSSAKKRKIEIRNLDFESDEEEKQHDTLVLGLSPIPQSRSPHGDCSKPTDDTGAVTETPSSSQSSGKSAKERETKVHGKKSVAATPVRRSKRLSKD